MTAEETALEEFRADVRAARLAIKWRRVARRDGEDEWEREERVRVYETIGRMRRLARIIRAIRRENRGDRMRASYEASVSEQVIHAETAWYDRGYAQGRRDALREAIDLCRRTEAGDTNHDWREAAKCCRELIESLAAQAAEEAAR